MTLYIFKNRRKLITKVNNITAKGYVSVS